MQNPITIYDITDLYVIVDDCLPKKTIRAGRPSALSDSEIITILVWCTIRLKSRTIKDIYEFIQLYHRNDFSSLPDYSSFVRHCNRLNPVLVKLLQGSLQTDSQVQFVDSTMLPVCRDVRADHHKVAKKVAAFGKNHQGWHYGFKLHATVNAKGQLCGFYFTPANFHDAQALPYLIRGKMMRIIVGDGGYNASVMRNKLWEENNSFVLAYPHPKQKSKLMAGWQKIFLRARPKVECVFDYLKNHLSLVTSFPRSVNGYFFNYLRNLLAYQFMVAAL